MTINRNKIHGIKIGYTKTITKIFYRGLDSISISLYVYLCSCTEKFNPSVTTIAKRLQISRPTVIKRLQILQWHNIIRCKTVGTSYKSTVYEFLPPEDWKKLDEKF